MGRGDGVGEGGGQDTGTNVAAGGGVAIFLVVCFYCIGIPVLFVGAVLIAISTRYNIIVFLALLHF